MAQQYNGIAYSGRKVQVGLAVEGTRGTIQNPSYWSRWETFDFFDNATTTPNQSAIGVLDKYSQAEITETWGEGTLASKITDQTYGLLLYSIFGADSVNLASGVYTHTFTESQANQAASLTITRVDPNQQLQYALSMVNQHEIEVKVGDFVRHTTSFISQPGVATSGQIPVLTNENEFKAKYVVAKMATTTAGFPGATAIPVNNLKLTINKDVARYHVVGQNNPLDIFCQTVEVTGEFQLLYTDNTYFTPRFANTIEAIEFVITNTDVTIGTSTNPSITFIMPQTYLNTIKIDNAIDGMVQQTVGFTATYSIAAGYAIQGILVNAVPSYTTGGGVRDLEVSVADATYTTEFVVA
jgi:hypothetical protein